MLVIMNMLKNNKKIFFKNTCILDRISYNKDSSLIFKESHRPGVEAPGTMLTLRTRDRSSKAMKIVTHFKLLTQHNSNKDFKKLPIFVPKIACRDGPALI